MARIRPSTVPSKKLIFNFDGGISVLFIDALTAAIYTVKLALEDVSVLLSRTLNGSKAKEPCVYAG